MSDPYLTGTVWRLTTMTPAQRRESEEMMGRFAAGCSRGWRRLRRAR